MDVQCSLNLFFKFESCFVKVANVMKINMLYSVFSFPVSQALRENTYPFLALIVLRENRMTVVARIEGPIGENI